MLYGIGFLGARRGEAFEYAHSAHRPLDGSEQEFCIHPCFRQALHTTTASNVTSYRPLATRPPALRRNWLGLEVAFRGDEAHLLFDAMDEAGERAARMFEDMPMASELRAELLKSVAAMQGDIREKRNAPNSIDWALEQTRWVSQFFAGLANDLSADEELRVTAGRVQRIGDGLEELAVGLVRYGSRPSEIS